MSRLVQIVAVLVACTVASPPATAELIAIPASAFMDDEGNRESFGHTVFFTVSGGISPWAGTVCGSAPLLLPDGAEVTLLGMWAFPGGHDLILDLLRKPVGADAAPTVVSNVTAFTGGTAPTFPTRALSHVVDRGGYAYSLRFCSSSGVLYGAVLEFVGRGAHELESASPVTVHPTAFRESAGLDEVRYDANAGYVHTIWGGQDGTWSPVAPLQLPEGSILKSLELTVTNPSSDNFSLWLKRKRLSTTAPAQVLAAIVNDPGEPAARRYIDVTIAEPVVSDRYHYYLEAAGLDGTDQQRIHDVRVTHDRPELVFEDDFETGDVSRWSDPADGPPLETLVLSSAAFRPHWSSWDTRKPPEDTVLTYDNEKGMLRLSEIVGEGAPGPEGPFCAIAPLVLPHKARLTGWAAWGVDTDPGLDMTVELLEKNASLDSTVDYAPLSTITSFGSPGVWGRLEVLDHEVDNLVHNLTVRWCQADEGVDPADFALIGLHVYHERP